MNTALSPICNLTEMNDECEIVRLYRETLRNILVRLYLQSERYEKRPALAVSWRNMFIAVYDHILRYMPQVTTVRMRTDTKALLDDLKLNPRETYDDVVRRLAEAAYDDEPMTSDEIAAMEEGIADLKAGRVRSLRDIMKELGDDTVIESGNP